MPNQVSVKDIDRAAELAVKVLDLISYLRSSAAFVAKADDDEVRGNPPCSTIVTGMTLTRSRVFELRDILCESIPLERALRELHRSDYGTRIQWTDNSVWTSEAWGKIREKWWLNSATEAVVSYGGEFWQFSYVQGWGPLFGALCPDTATFLNPPPGYVGPTRFGGQSILDPDDGETPGKYLEIREGWPETGYDWRSWGRSAKDYPQFANPAEVKQWIAREAENAKVSLAEASQTNHDVIDIGLDAEDETILKQLANKPNHLFTIVEIGKVSGKTAGKRLNLLIDKGYAVRPKGKNGGVQITENGIDLAKRANLLQEPK